MIFVKCNDNKINDTIGNRNSDTEYIFYFFSKNYHI